MADSDEELDRRRDRRDRFRRERTDHDQTRRPGDKREPFDDRPVSQRADKRPFETTNRYNGMGASDNNNNNDRRSRSPYKRRRYDDNDGGDSQQRTTSYGGRSRDQRAPGSYGDQNYYRPPLVPFKRFLEPLDDLITEVEASKKYQEYKETYHKRHIEDFFEAHKNEEWLRFRYHPDHMESHKQMTESNLKHRLDVFMHLFNEGYLNDQSVQMDNSEALIRLMDAFVIKLEGGSDADVAALWSQSQKRGYVSSDNEERDLASPSDGGDKPKSKAARRDNEPAEEGEDFGSSSEGEDSRDEGDAIDDDDERTGDAQSRDAVDPDLPSTDPEVHVMDPPDNKSAELAKSSPAGEDGDNITVDPEGDRNSDNDNHEENEEIGEDGDEEEARSSPATPTEDELSVTTAPDDKPTSPRQSPNNVVEQLPTANDHQSGQMKWPLHKTSSIFFRSLPPTVTEAELTELCSSQPGFMRLALWDPVPERRFNRHAWATYNPTVNIKKICWTLNNSAGLASTSDLGASVNRDLAQRVRPLTPITRHRPVMLADVRLASRLVARLDALHKLWHVDDDDEQPVEAAANEENQLLASALSSTNPLLRHLTDYLVDEGGSEEEALLSGLDSNGGGDQKLDGDDTNRPPQMVPLEPDPSLAGQLDHLILYLRFVHSVDFYASTVYPVEDNMPHRCGILHARGDRGINRSIANSGGLMLRQTEIDDYVRNFAPKMRTLIEIPSDLTDEEMVKLGKRDPEQAAEQFIEANIQKRTGKKKPFKVVWVCPLSDKKFREPIFVRKHILNKHPEKVEASKLDALFFNNYLRDPRRPALPEAPQPQQSNYQPSYQQYHQRGPPPWRSGGGDRRNTFRPPPMGGGYRSSTNANALLPTAGSFNRNTSYNDYYDSGNRSANHGRLAAVAAAAAAALGNSTGSGSNSDLVTNALASAIRGPSGGGYRNQRPPGGGRPMMDNRRPGRHRAMVSYTDLDDPGE